MGKRQEGEVARCRDQMGIYENQALAQQDGDARDWRCWGSGAKSNPPELSESGGICGGKGIVDVLAAVLLSISNFHPLPHLPKFVLYRSTTIILRVTTLVQYLKYKQKMQEVLTRSSSSFGRRNMGYYSQMLMFSFRHLQDVGG